MLVESQKSHDNRQKRLATIALRQLNVQIKTFHCTRISIKRVSRGGGGGGGLTCRR